MKTYRKKEHRTSEKSPMPMMWIAAALFCLVLASCYMMSGLYARYAVSSTGTDGARVAAFQVLFDGFDEDVVIDCKTEDDGSYLLEVKNQSEVAVDIKVTVRLKDALDERLTMRLTDAGSEETEYSADWSIDKETAVYSVGILDIGEAEAYSLIFEIDDWSWVTESVEKKITAERNLEFFVDLEAAQVD